MLTFMNHTECACVERDSNSPATVLELSTPQSRTSSSGSSILTTPPENMQSCKCPEEFSPVYGYVTKCSCDCEDFNEDCDRMKKGKEYFSLTDRKCILDEICGIPQCEYGAYIKSKGRCPREEEKFEEFANMNLNNL